MAGAVMADAGRLVRLLQMVRDGSDGCWRVDGCRDPATPQS